MDINYNNVGWRCSTWWVKAVLCWNCLKYVVNNYSCLMFYSKINIIVTLIDAAFVMLVSCKWACAHIKWHFESLERKKTDHSNSSSRNDFWLALPLSLACLCEFGELFPTLVKMFTPCMFSVYQLFCTFFFKERAYSFVIMMRTHFCRSTKMDPLWLAASDTILSLMHVSCSLLGDVTWPQREQRNTKVQYLILSSSANLKFYHCHTPFP